VMALASQNRTDPLAFVRNTALFGNLADREGFTTPYTRTLTSLHTKGARETLSVLLSQTT
jgi:mannitol 2-dehydrogenase